MANHKTTHDCFLEAGIRKQIKNELRIPNKNLAVMLMSNGISYPHLDPTPIDIDSITGNSLRDIKINLKKYARIINRRLSKTEVVDDEFRVNRSFKDKLKEELIVYTPFSLELQDGQILTGLGRQYGSDKGYTTLKKNEAIKITKWFLNSADITPLVMPSRAVIKDDNKIAKLIAHEIDKNSKEFKEAQGETTDPAKIELRNQLQKEIAELKAKLGETQADSIGYRKKGSRTILKELRELDLGSFTIWIKGIGQDINGNSTLIIDDGAGKTASIHTGNVSIRIDDIANDREFKKLIKNKDFKNLLKVVILPKAKRMNVKRMKDWKKWMKENVGAGNDR